MVNFQLADLPENVRFFLAIVIAAGVDILNWYNPEFILPIVGTPLHLIVMFVIFGLLRDWRVFISVTEAISAADYIPMYTIVSSYVIAKKKLARKPTEVVPNLHSTTGKLGVIFISLFVIALIAVVYLSVQYFPIKFSVLPRLS